MLTRPPNMTTTTLAKMTTSTVRAVQLLMEASMTRMRRQIGIIIRDMEVKRKGMTMEGMGRARRTMITITMGIHRPIISTKSMTIERKQR